MNNYYEENVFLDFDRLLTHSNINDEIFGKWSLDRISFNRKLSFSLDQKVFLCHFSCHWNSSFSVIFLFWSSDKLMTGQRFGQLIEFAKKTTTLDLCNNSIKWSSTFRDPLKYSFEMKERTMEELNKIFQKRKEKKRKSFCPWD